MVNTGNMDALVEAVSTSFKSLFDGSLHYMSAHNSSEVILCLFVCFILERQCVAVYHSAPFA